MTWENRIVGSGMSRAGDLLANEKNWRIHGKSQQDALSAVLGNVGWVAQIIVNKRSDPSWGNKQGIETVVDGHLRVELALSQGEDTEVPVTYVDLSEQEEGLILASFDPIAAMAAADREQLGELLKGIESEDAAIKQMLESIAQENKIPFGIKEGLTDDDDMPEEVETICKTGDLWQLGDHRLLCGDATKKEDVERLMQGEKADALITDPPYGINLDTDYSNPDGHGAFRGRAYNPVIGDDKPFDASGIRQYLPNVQEQFWFGANYYYRTLGAADGAGSWLVWDKRVEETKDAVIGSAFELCWSANKHAQRILRYQWTNWTSQYNEGMKREHPTEKPVAMFCEIIERWIGEGDIILDPFGGSGSTLIACEKLGRKCRMMEIDEHYCDVIMNRWQNYTGKEAVKL